MLWDRYNAIVTDNQDPDKLGRVKVRCAMLVSHGSALPFWIPPAQWYMSKANDSGDGCGWFWVPEVGSVVMIEVLKGVRGDFVKNQSMVMNPDVRYYPAPYSPVSVPGDDFTGANYPKIRGLKTPSGHVLVFDDTTGSETITLRHSSGGSYITIDKAGTVTIEAPRINIGADADNHLTRAEDLKAFIQQVKTYLDSHLHPTGVGPSGPPTTPMPAFDDAIISTKHWVK